MAMLIWSDAENAIQSTCVTTMSANPVTATITWLDTNARKPAAMEIWVCDQSW